MKFLVIYNSMNDSKTFAIEKSCPNWSNNWHSYTICQHLDISNRSLFFFFCKLLSQLVLPSQWGIVNLIQFWSLLSCVCFLRLHTFSIQRKTLQNKERQEAEESQLDRALLGSYLNMKPPCMAEDLPPVSFFLWTNITFASQLVLHSVTYQVPAPTKNLCWK